MKTKRLIIILMVFLLLTLNITACNTAKIEEDGSIDESSENAIPTEAEVMEAYSKARSFYINFSLAYLNVDETKPLERDGNTYYPVDDQIDGKPIKTMKDFRDSAKKVLSEDLVKKMFDGSRSYIEVDGVLYSHGGAKGGDVDFGAVTYLYERVSDTKMLLTARAEYAPENKDGSRLGQYIESRVSVYEKIGDNWVYTAFSWF